MSHINRTLIVTIMSACAALAGCASQMTAAEMQEIMSERPAELDKLNAFVGKWEMTSAAESEMQDEPLTASGTMEAAWQGDGWYLVQNAVFRMGDDVEMKGIEIWTYDRHSKKYRFTWVGGGGAISAGVGTHDEDTNTWRIKAKGYGPLGKTSGKGEMTFIDDNTIEWSFSEYSGLKKVMEMSGTNRRVD